MRASGCGRRQSLVRLVGLHQRGRTRHCPRRTSDLRSRVVHRRRGRRPRNRSRFTLASATFASRRAYLTSNGSFRTYLLQTVVLAAVGCVGLAIVLGAGTSNQVWLWVPLTLANIAAAIAVSPRRHSYEGHRFKRFARLWPFVRSIDAPRTMARLIVVTLIAVTLSNGTLMVARLVGAPPTEIVAYAAAINLVLIPFTLINSFTGPIHNRFVQSIMDGDFVQVQKDYFSSGTRYLLAVGGFSLASYFGLGYVIGWYVGGGYSLSAAACFSITLAEGLATVTALPRALLVALGESRLVTPIWVAGLFVFTGTLFVWPLEPLARLVLAPGLASLTILIASTVVIRLGLAERIATSRHQPLQSR